MHKSFYLLSFVLLSLCTGIMSSCREHGLDFDPVAINYQKDFNKFFGNVDPNHTWNTATIRTLDYQINISGDYSIKVFANSPRQAGNKSVLLADFAGPFTGGTGQKYSFNFDCPTGLQSVWVALEGGNLPGYVLEEVPINSDGKASVKFGGEASATRGIVHAVDSKGTGWPNEYVYKAQGAAATTIFKKAAYDGTVEDHSFLSIIPEQQPNAAKPGVASDFVFVSTGQTYNLYPMYVYTGADVSIGVQYRASATDTWSTDFIFWETKSGKSDNDPSRITQVYEDKSKDQGSRNGAGWYYTNVNKTNNGSPFSHTECDGITFNFPEGYQFRFSVHQNPGFIRYSERAANSDGKSYFATFNNGYRHTGLNDSSAGDPVLFVGVEDWTNSVIDLNDVVMAFVGQLPLVVEEGSPVYTSAEYLIAFEDMGTNDFDFNDVVISVEHTAGRTEAVVSVEAVGGTLPVYLGYDNSILEFALVDGNNHSDPLSGHQNCTELHDVLSAGTASSSTPLNVDKNSHNDGKTVEIGALKYPARSRTITVAENFSIVSHASSFFIRVNDADGTSREIHPYDATKDIGTTPQAFVVADPYWAWPTESTAITSAYSDFSTWVANANQQDWYSPFWSGNDGNSSTVHEETTTVMPDIHFDKCIKDRAAIGESKSITITRDELRALDITDNETTIAFVVTGRDRANNEIITITAKFEDNSNVVPAEHIQDGASTNTSSSYGEADKFTVNWGEHSSFTLAMTSSKGESSTAKLNSVWTLTYKNQRLITGSNISEILTKVNDEIEICLMNPSTDRPRVLGCEVLENAASTVFHAHGGTTLSMKTLADAIATNSTYANYVFKLRKVDDGYTLTSKHGGKSLTKSGNALVWDTTAQTFTLANPTSRPGNVTIAEVGIDDMFRITIDNNHLNANYLDWRGGTGDWSVWCIFQLNP